MRSEQLEFASVDGYEAETLFGVTGPAFPVVIQPCSTGAIVQAPAWVGFRAWVDDVGSTHVELSFPAP